MTFAAIPADSNTDSSIEIVTAGLNRLRDLFITRSMDDLAAELRAAVLTDAPSTLRLMAVNEALATLEAQANVARVRSFPVNAQIAITDVCNARCTFCAYTPERVSSQTIDIDKIRNCDWLRFSRTLSLTAGLGDCFAHPQIDDILALLRADFPYLSVLTITNASLMREKAVQNIAGYLRHINLSLNAARKETYERIMAPLKWDVTIGNLRRLREVKLERGTVYPKLIASYVLSLQNLEELPEFPALLEELGIPTARVNYMVPPPQSGSRQLMTKADTIFNEPEKADHYIDLFRKAAISHGVALAKPLPRISRGGTSTSWSDDEDDPIFVAARSGGQAKPKSPGFVRGAGFAAPDGDDSRNQPSARAAGAKKVVRPVSVSKPGEVSRSNEPDNTNWDVVRPDVSTEFVDAVLNGEDPWCNQPWFSLSVDMMARTTVCCAFFQRFPEFDWKPARTFHDGFWNHPAMQHMRRTLNTPEEVPYCTFCKTKDKRDSRYVEERRRTARQSSAIIDRVVDESMKVVRNPELDKYDPSRHPVDLSISASGMRRSIRSRNLMGHDRVLVVGAIGQSMLPFLAEANGEVVVVDERPVDRAIAFAERFGCRNLVAQQVPSIYEPAVAGTFDLAIIAPEILFASDRLRLLRAVSDMLVAGGRVSITGAMSYGDMIGRWLRRGDGYRGMFRVFNRKTSVPHTLDSIAGLPLTTRIEAAAHLVPDVLAAGPAYEGPCNFVTIGSIQRVANRWPLELDKQHFPLANRIGGSGTPVSDLERKVDRLPQMIRDHAFESAAKADFDKTCAGLERNLVLQLVKPGQA